MFGRLSILTLIVTIFAAVAANAQTSIALPSDRAFPENIAASHDGAIHIGSVGAGGVPNFFRDLAGDPLNTSRSCDHVE